MACLERIHDLGQVVGMDDVLHLFKIGRLHESLLGLTASVGKTGLGCSVLWAQEDEIIFAKTQAAFMKERSFLVFPNWKEVSAAA